MKLRVSLVSYWYVMTIFLFCIQISDTALAVDELCLYSILTPPRTLLSTKIAKHAIRDMNYRHSDAPAADILARAAYLQEHGDANDFAHFARGLIRSHLGKPSELEALVEASEGFALAPVHKKLIQRAIKQRWGKDAKNWAEASRLAYQAGWGKGLENLPKPQKSLSRGAESLVKTFIAHRTRLNHVDAIREMFRELGSKVSAVDFVDFSLYLMGRPLTGSESIEALQSQSDGYLLTVNQIARLDLAARRKLGPTALPREGFVGIKQSADLFILAIFLFPITSTLRLVTARNRILNKNKWGSQSYSRRELEKGIIRMKANEYQPTVVSPPPNPLRPVEKPDA